VQCAVRCAEKVEEKNIPLDPPSKGELCATMVDGILNETCSEAETIPYLNTTRSVVRLSPFEGGSRGMFFFRTSE
jgi:hypothetical protein